MQNQATAPLPTLGFHVLLVLAEGRNHGYGIAKLVEENTGGRTKPGTGSLYLSMAKLREQGLIEVTSAPSGADARRRYYRLTGEGRQAAAAECRRMERLVALGRRHRLLDEHSLEGV